VFWRALQKQVLENFDRSTFISIDRLRAKFRSIDQLLSSIDRLFRTSEFPGISL